MQAASRWCAVPTLSLTMIAGLGAQSSPASKINKNKPAPAPKLVQDVEALRNLVSAQTVGTAGTASGRSSNGRLGFKQLIAAPRQAEAAAQKDESRADGAQNTAAQAEQSATESAARGRPGLGECGRSQADSIRGKQPGAG
jgi:hypothetical protein